MHIFIVSVAPRSNVTHPPPKEAKFGSHLCHLVITKPIIVVLASNYDVCAREHLITLITTAIVLKRGVSVSVLISKFPRKSGFIFSQPSVGLLKPVWFKCVFCVVLFSASVSWIHKIGDSFRSYAP